MTVKDLVFLKQLSFEKSPWHSVRNALKDITDKEFFWVPNNHKGFEWMNGSICDVVYHLAGDILVQLSGAFGGGEIRWENVIELIPKNNMENMLFSLKESHEKYLDCLNTFDDEKLQEEVVTSWGQTMKAKDLFIMLIEHDYYHAGQIRYIRNVFPHGS